MITRPRVGHRITLRSGVKGDIVSVEMGVEALRHKTEVQMIILGPSMQSALGANWMNSYYEATIELPDSSILIVTPKDVAEIECIQ